MFAQIGGLLIPMLRQLRKTHLLKAYIDVYHVIVRDCYAKETSPLAMNMKISPFKGSDMEPALFTRIYPTLSDHCLNFPECVL
jgi:hypothetical protein